VSDKAHGKQGSKKRKWIGTMELAEKLGCHPFSIPRFVKTKPGFPKPVKPFGKNLWDEDEVDAYLAQLLAEKEIAAAI
jgi:predicted DNA-binding transcriptional regulator AlpA